MRYTKTAVLVTFILLLLSASATSAATITVDDSTVDVWDVMCLIRLISGVGV